MYQRIGVASYHVSKLHRLQGFGLGRVTAHDLDFNVDLEFF